MLQGSSSLSVDPTKSEGLFPRSLMSINCVPSKTLQLGSEKPHTTLPVKSLAKPLMDTMFSKTMRPAESEPNLSVSFSNFVGI